MTETYAKDSDHLEFKIINPYGIEDWVEDSSVKEVVEIYINGKEIIEILKEIEIPFANNEGHISIAGAYGHLTPNELYSELMDSEESALVCCGDCGLIGCWAVVINVEMDEDYVYWKEFRHNHRDWEYNISFKFHRTEYENVLKKIFVQEGY